MTRLSYFQNTRSDDKMIAEDFSNTVFTLCSSAWGEFIVHISTKRSKLYTEILCEKEILWEETASLLSEEAGLVTMYNPYLEPVVAFRRKIVTWSKAEPTLWNIAWLIRWSAEKSFSDSYLDSKKTADDSWWAYVFIIMVLCASVLPLVPSSCMSMLQLCWWSSENEFVLLLFQPCVDPGPIHRSTQQRQVRSLFEL